MPDIANQSIRPKSLDEIIGLDEIKKSISYDLMGAKIRGCDFPHYVLSAAPGQGKTTLAGIIAAITEGNVHKMLGNDLKTADDIYTVLQQAKDGDVIFVEEAHGINRKVDTVLLPILEEGEIIGGANWGLLKAPKVIFIFATTNAGRLSQALRNRCKTLQLRFYSVDELSLILKRASKILGYDFSDDEAVRLLAQSSRGTPRTAVEQRLEAVLNVMAVDNIPFCVDAVQRSLDLNGVNQWGLERNDLNYCETLYRIQQDNGNRPVALKIISQTLNLADDVITTIEQYLNQIGAIIITSRGRILSKLGYEIINRENIPDNIEITADLNFLPNDQEVKKIAQVPDLKTRLENGDFKTIRDICTAYNLRYGTDNPIIKMELAKYGYTAVQRGGIKYVGK
jgi:Holliday junction DNA helicase RuvB